ncbi:hypothetical protein M569_14162 [Genlisea aurea]|uniref:Calcineurin-like phosphoesterase domain-containing protein n=1 Tax=Genlisea aurea TaxID=192259 RepID=S8C1K2_9LAMI|nr:hypothetical protein M569_14162 [Genlisea aurea]
MDDASAKLFAAAAAILWISFLGCCYSSLAISQRLKFDGETGEFRILQVADMHFGNGKTTRCLDVYRSEKPWCSDLNTSAFIRRMILTEKPDLIVFTGDNIFGFDATDAAASMDMAFAPAITSNIPWVAVLGNHDQESGLSRKAVMQHIVGMNNTLSQLNPSPDDDDDARLFVDRFGNYNLEVNGVAGSRFAHKSVLNLYFLDSGDYSTIPSVSGYGWITRPQKQWFQNTSSKLKRRYMNGPEPQKGPAPGLVYFHIPLPEFSSFDESNLTTGVMQEDVCSPSVNSGFFKAVVEAEDVKAVFVGHDHLNDFCGQLTGINLCYAGGFGYHAYGKTGWPRRARMVSVSLGKLEDGSWGDVNSVRTWKRLDDEELTAIDEQVLWTKTSRRKHNLD